MSSSSDGRPAAVCDGVLRGAAAGLARPARIDSPLASSAFAPASHVDARLTDPYLAEVVESARLAAAEQGRARGREAGLAAGLAEAAEQARQTAERTDAQRQAAEKEREARVRQALDVLGQAAQAFREAQQVAVADVEDAVVELALALARAVLDRELAVASDPGSEALARALALAPDGAAATARLHPDDVAALTDAAARFPGRDLVVVPDPRVERGGCVLDAAGRSIDAQVGPALERIAQVLR